MYFFIFFCILTIISSSVFLIRMCFFIIPKWSSLRLKIPYPVILQSFKFYRIDTWRIKRTMLHLYREKRKIFLDDKNFDKGRKKKNSEPKIKFRFDKYFIVWMVEHPGYNPKIKAFSIIHFQNQVNSSIP